RAAHARCVHRIPHARGVSIFAPPGGLRWLHYGPTLGVFPTVVAILDALRAVTAACDRVPVPLVRRSAREGQDPPEAAPGPVARRGMVLAVVVGFAAGRLTTMSW